MKGPIGRRPKGDVVVKALFATSGNVCAFFDPDTVPPGCEQTLADPSWEAVQAVICHIHGWSPDGPRYLKGADDDRNNYENLILLCPTHSNLIDRVRPTDFPPEKLRAMKARHEESHGGGRSGWKVSDDVLSRFAEQAVALTARWVTLLAADRATDRTTGSAVINREAFDSAGVSDSAVVSLQRVTGSSYEARHGRLDFDNDDGIPVRDDGPDTDPRY